MARRLSTEEMLARLKDSAAKPLSSAGMVVFRRALAGKNNILAGKAAQLAGQCGARELCPNMVEAFERFLNNPGKTDKMCHAKIAIIEALDTLNYAESDAYLSGIRHVQMEPAYGGPVDSAAELRALSVLALIRTGYREARFELTTLLTDRESQPRRATARALATLGGETDELLLRLKVQAGDAEPEVLGECFLGLMQIAAKRSLAFITGYLDDQNAAVAQEAALAVGGSRLPQAFEILRERYESPLWLRGKDTLLLPIALTRSDSAFEFLLEVVRTESRGLAVQAVRALQMYRGNDQRHSEIAETVAERGDHDVCAAFQEACA